MLTRYTQKNLTWVDLMGPSAQEVRELMHEFGFNPLIGQELLSASIKSKVERYDGTIYAVFHFPRLSDARIQRTTQELDIIIGKEYLITARYEHMGSLSTFAKAFEVGSVLSPSGGHMHGGHLFAAILKNVYRELLIECDTMKTKLLEVEEQLFSGNEKYLVMEISQISRIIYDFRQALLPHAQMLKSLEAPLSRIFGQEFSYYLRGIEAEYGQVVDETDALRDAMQELRETNNSMLNAKQSEVIKNFTVLAFVFIPVSLIMSLYQMDLPHTPFAGQIDFWAIMGAIFALSAGFFFYSKYKGWL